MGFYVDVYFGTDSKFCRPSEVFRVTQGARLVWLNIFGKQTETSLFMIQQYIATIDCSLLKSPQINGPLWQIGFTHKLVQRANKQPDQVFCETIPTSVKNQIVFNLRILVSPLRPHHATEDFSPRVKNHYLLCKQFQTTSVFRIWKFPWV